MINEIEQQIADYLRSRNYSEETIEWILSDTSDVSLNWQKEGF